LVPAAVHPIFRTAQEASYEIPAGAWDEAFEPDGVLRTCYEDVFAALAEGPPERIAAAVTSSLSRGGVRFRTAAGDVTFPIDPVPRIIGAAEWRELEASAASPRRVWSRSG
jgi:uncharacterized circularly permuted ATP-grasp superfamily protein